MMVWLLRLRVRFWHAILRLAAQRQDRAFDALVDHEAGQAA
jgi:hypothetical protein